MPETVAFFLPHFGHGGAEGVVLRLLQGLDRRRFACLLVLQRRQGEFLNLVPTDVPVLALRRPRPPLCILDLARIYARRRIALAVTVTNATNFYSVLAARLAGPEVRTLVTEHTPPSAFFEEAGSPRLRRAAVRALYPMATLAGGPLEQIGEELEALLGATAPPFATLPNPVTDRAGVLRPPRRTAHRVVAVGRLAPEKRFDLLIDAFAELRRTMPQARLTIYGEGPERPTLEGRIRDAGLTAHACLPGYTADLDAAHGAADLFVCSSRREGLGNAIIEAMARGVPVVSVDCPFGPRRLLRDGAAGLLVEEASPSALARAMKTVLDDAALRARYAEAALDVARGFQVETAVAEYAAAFDRALASGPRTRRSAGSGS
jgi:glycosyltransferase involved in cell wall biosynthesis